MRFGNRLYPYPVLYRDETLSGYKPEFAFGLEFDDITQKEGMLVFNNLRYEINEPTLCGLIEQGKVKGVFIVESSASVFREKFDISANPSEIKIPLKNLRGTVVASCCLCAVENIPDFKSDQFLDEYNGYSFEIDKFGILAVDDGVSFRVDTDPAQYNKVSSIFTIVKKVGDSSKLMSYENQGGHIAIYLPEEYYRSYDFFKNDGSYNNIAFAMIAIPALAASLYDLGEIESITDTEEDYAWFKAVCIGYKRVTGNELTCEVFNDLNKLELAQMVLNDATCTGIRDFEYFLMNQIVEEDDSDE